MEHRDTVRILNDALERELGAIVQFLHHSFLVFGPGRAPIQAMLRERARHSYEHAILLGEKVTALGGHPSAEPRVAHPPGEQSMEEMLAEDLELEREVLQLYVDSLDLVRDDVGLDHMFRQIILDRQGHLEEFEKLLRT